MGNSLQFILPETVLVVFAFAAALISVFSKNRQGLDVFVLSGIALSGAFLLETTNVPPALFSGMLANDGFTLFFRTLILWLAALVVMISMGYRGIEEDSKGEYYFFLLSMTVSMMLAVAAKNLMMIYLALEGVSLISYILAGYLKRDLMSSEAGIKYFLFGAFSTAVTLYGISLIYGLFGTLDLALFAQNGWAGVASNPAFIFALILVLVGFGFKCSLVPFHMWTPDVYEGAPAPVAAFFSVGPKAMGFALLFRVFLQFTGMELAQWTTIAVILAAATMTMGNVLALTQNNVKRLLAYSTIAQAGYMFTGLALATDEGLRALLFYLTIYGLANLGAFAGIVAAYNVTKSDALESYSGLSKKDPFLAVMLMICLLSLAGLPPLAGFLAKFFIISAAVKAKFTGLAVLIVLNSVIALYYYVRVVKVMFLYPEGSAAADSAPSVAHSSSLRLALVLIVAGNIIFGIFPQVVFDWLASMFMLTM